MIDIRPVGHILGWLVLVLGLLMVPCILIDLSTATRTPASSR